MTMQIKLDPGALMPVRAYEDDAGLDLRSPYDVIVYPHDRVMIDTGVHVMIPRGHVGFLKSKSGLMANAGLTSDGTIDSGYNGSIGVVLFNHTEFDYLVHRGDKISQLVIQPVFTPDLEVVDELPETERGSYGFGSTGR